VAGASTRVRTNGWIGVDLDGTLSLHEENLVIGKEIGGPVPVMVDRVRSWLRQGWEVRIVTARVSSNLPQGFRDIQKELIKTWTRLYVGTELEAVSEKDFNMLELWDDRARRVEANTGRIIG
jgi:hypothetical protein